MKNIQTLLNNVSHIVELNQKITDEKRKRGELFNVFQIVQLSTQEVQLHSNMIGELLDVNGIHGMKDTLLKAFIEVISLKEWKYDTANSRVRLELSIGNLNETKTEGGRIDIALFSSDEKAIIIENKIYASDEDKQLLRYHNYGKKEELDFKLIYLNLFGNEPKENSLGEEPKKITKQDYLHITYQEHIKQWIERCIELSTRHPLVRETLVQYLGIINQLTYQTMDTTHENELIEQIANNLNAAHAITQNYNNAFEYLAEKYFNPKMEKFAEKHKLIYHYDGSSDSYIKFNFQKASWENKYSISFSTYGNEYYYGLCNHIYNSYCISDENREIIHEHLKNECISSFKVSDYYPFYICINYLSVDTWKSDIIEGDKFAKECQETVLRLLKVIEGVNL
ncbi:MAG: PD-(D/E)XK nuclease family protein [Bacteroidales bacterium]